MAVIHNRDRSHRYARYRLKYPIRKYSFIACMVVNFLTLAAWIAALMTPVSAALHPSSHIVYGLRRFSDGWLSFIYFLPNWYFDFCGKYPSLWQDLLMLFLYFLATFFGFVIGVIGFLITSTDSARWSGFRGEFRALETLSTLPDSYHVFVNLEFELRGHHETDFIVVGPGGVCVCEVKYWSGTVIFNKNDFKSVTRISKDNARTSSAHSLRHQVCAHYETLRDALWKQGIQVPVHGMVLMMHPNVIVQDYSSSDIPVLITPTAATIQRRMGYLNLHSEDIAAIVAGLERIAL